MTEAKIIQPQDPDTRLFDALWEGKGRTAGDLMQARTHLSGDEIQLIADLLVGDPLSKRLHPSLLKFVRRRGAPGDPLERSRSSQAWGRAVEDLVRQTWKVEAALEAIKVTSKRPISTLKKDRQLFKRLWVNK